MERDSAADLLAYLGRAGPSTARDAMAHLGISQPAFSRLVARSRGVLLVVGRARATRYAALREVPGVGRSVPLYEIGEDGSSRSLGILRAIRPRGFHLEALGADADSGFFDDLPYFLHELRPAGFLGRMVPRRHPELGLPDDIQLWTADHCLAYVTRYGWNLPGNLIAGDEAFRLYLAHVRNPPDVVDADARPARYAALAEDVLGAGAPGSSAAGEQPKFLVARTPGPVHVLVKFSPPIADPVSQRLSDLLVAEHLALETLRAHGHDAARSQLVQGAGRTFLEVERFDRLAGHGRKGLLSLFALDAEFVGRFRGWTDTAAELHRQGRIDAAMLERIRWRELFGSMIANADMHAGNLSFFVRGTRIIALAPAYDMAPSLYAPQGAHLRDPAFDLPLPAPGDAAIWGSVHAAAGAFWAALAADARVSEGFRALAARNARVIEGGRDLARLLPEDSGRIA